MADIAKEIPEMSNEWPAEARTLSMILSRFYKKRGWSADDCVRVDTYRKQLIWLLVDHGFMKPAPSMRQRTHPVLGTTYMERIEEPSQEKQDYEWIDAAIESAPVQLAEDSHNEYEYAEDDEEDEWDSPAEESDEWTSE
jgi:hypothetical protein